MNLDVQRMLLGIALTAFWVPAYAYIDPGTGSALIQGVIAAIAAVGVSLKLYWHRIKNLMRRNRDSAAPPDETGQR